MSNDPNASVPLPPRRRGSKSGAGIWSTSRLPISVKYFFTPTNLAELKFALAEAANAPGATIRVSGQRHSQPPLVVDDDRDAASQTKAFLVDDMSCYKDLGPGQDQRIVLGPGSKQVTVNAGVREDELDAFLTQNNLMLTTVTARGCFSLGGMTAVDVHGGTMDAPIFAETVSAFNLLLADGRVTAIDTQSPAVGGWSPLQFARVSLGGLGVVTSVTINVVDRPWATTLQGGRAVRARRQGGLREDVWDAGEEPHSVGDVLHPVRHSIGRLPFVRKKLPRAVVGRRQRSADEDAERAALSGQCLCPRGQAAEFGAPYLGDP